MPSDDLDPMRAFRESLAVQQSALTAVSQLTIGTSVVRDMIAVQKLLQPFNQWRALTVGSDLQRSLGAVSEFNQWLTAWSSAITAISTALPDIGALRSALAIPVGELRLLTEVPAVELDDEARQSLADLSGAIDEEDKADAPSVLSEWLLWLPSAAQTRVTILGLGAMYAILEALSKDAGTSPVDPHIAVIVYALATIVAFLEAANRG